MRWRDICCNLLGVYNYLQLLNLFTFLMKIGIYIRLKKGIKDAGKNKEEK